MPNPNVTRQYGPWREVAYSEFTGLDLRTSYELGDPHTLIEAVNVDITTGRDIKTRDQVRKICDLHAESRGLYVVGNELHTCLPYRYAAERSTSNGIVYDMINDSAGTWENGTKTLVGVTASMAYDRRPYLVVEYQHSNGSRGWEHHWIPATPMTYTGTATFTNGSTSVSASIPSGTDLSIPSTATIYITGMINGTTRYKATSFSHVGNTLTFQLTTNFDGASGAHTFGIFPPADTQIALPFTPGPAAVMAANKIWASQRFTPDVWFSSTLNGPTDWMEQDDAGFLPTSHHIDGQQEIQGLGTFQGQLVVMFDRAMQVWSINTDPSYNRLIDSVGGAGCTFPRSVANAMGDLYYFSNGAFRSITAVVTTGQKKEGDIGAKVAADTRKLSTSIRPVAVWSSYRQQYLCFIGTEAYVYTASPESDVFAWTKYSMQFSVESAAELDQKLYLRRDNSSEVWMFAPDYTGEVGFSWRARPPFLDLEVGHWLKEIKTFELHQEGSCNVAIYHSPEDLADYTELGEISGSTTEKGKVFFPVICEMFSPVYYGTKYWRLGQSVWRYAVGGLT